MQPNSQYAGPPAGYAQPPTAANSTAQAFNGMAVPQMVDATAPGAGDFKKTPQIRNLRGRVVALVATGYDPNRFPADPNNPNSRTEAVIFTTHIFEPGDVVFGEDKQKDTPPTHKITGPTYVTECASSNQEIVRQLKDRINPQAPIALVGVVERGTPKNPNHSPPYRIMPLAPDDPRRTLIGQYWTAYQQGQIAEAVPEELPAAPQSGGYVQQGANPAFQPQAQPAYAPTPAAAPVQAPPPGAQVHYGPPTQAAPAQPPIPPQPPAPPVAGAPNGGGFDPMQAPAPAGWEAVWPTMGPEQRAKVLGIA